MYNGGVDKRETEREREREREQSKAVEKWREYWVLSYVVVVWSSVCVLFPLLGIFDSVFADSRTTEKHRGINGRQRRALRFKRVQPGRDQKIWLDGGGKGEREKERNWFDNNIRWESSEWVEKEKNSQPKSPDDRTVHDILLLMTTGIYISI